MTDWVNTTCPGVLAAAKALAKRETGHHAPVGRLGVVPTKEPYPSAPAMAFRLSRGNVVNMDGADTMRL